MIFDKKKLLVYFSLTFRGVGRMRATVAAPLFCLLSFGTAGSAQPQPSPLRRILDSALVASGVPALAAALVTVDSVVVFDAVGVRRLGDTVRVTANDLFHIGSDTKAMTAGLVGLLVDAGTLHWSSTMAALFPELADQMHPSYRDVRLTDLLSHQSGLPPNPARSFDGETTRDQRANFAKWVLTQPPRSAKGTFSYANSNYILAGVILERAANGAYEELIAEKLFKPLGMTVGFGAAGTPGKVDQPWGHRVASNGSRTPIEPGPRSDNPPIFGPAGRAHLSMHDWGLWARAVLRASTGRPSPWTTETARALVEPLATIDSTNSYALGWLVSQRSWAQPGGRVLTHAGSNTVSYAVAWIAPEAGFGVLVAINQGSGAARPADAVAARLIEWYLKEGR
jgi:CubicO group peptidase (beta-lactamase class C family)